jgi:hypothetical protein
MPFTRMRERWFRVAGLDLIQIKTSGGSERFKTVREKRHTRVERRSKTFELMTIRGMTKVKEGLAAVGYISI